VNRVLIVNADDFGRSPGINRGVFQAFEHGIVTSASLMVRWPSAAEAADFTRSHPQLGLGLHVDLGEWFYDNNAWQCRYEVVPIDDVAAVERELKSQLEAFRTLTGLEPSHIDSHQHVHLRPGLRAGFLTLSKGAGVPLRRVDSPARYCGDFFGQTHQGAPLRAAIDTHALLQLVRQLPEGVTEIICHPALAADTDSSYGTERVLELEALCDRRVRRLVDRLGIRLCSYRSLSTQTRQLPQGAQ
jgi:predicted glycoside hydrolase/deacetylase ChbG (UPF0249 family)